MDIISVLGELSNRTAVEEMQKKMTEVIGAVRETGKSGALTISLKIQPASKGSTNVLILKEDIKATLPERDRSATIFYADKENQLSKSDPRQMPLEGLRAVPIDRPDELKDVAG
jgi:hypothetical protein